MAAFVDRVRILARAGHGGRGGLSFFRARHNPEGGPDGGNGGRGGDVVLVVNPHLNNLVKLKYSPHQIAENGRPGESRQRTGRSGEDCIIEVPPGTVVSRLPEDATDEKGANLPLAPIPGHDEELDVVLDLTEPEQRVILCEGGKGGLGNMAFKSSRNQAPRKIQPGLAGESGQYMLELKSIADVGLVGFPNAGKSTLLSRLSNAEPKIASYPFTTLTPQIGVIDFEDGARLTMADIPGLIEGAHEGIGLGHEFLRHIERCRVLLFVIDLAGTDAREPLADFQQLRRELSLYDETLAERPFLVVANKIDQPAAAERLDAFRAAVRAEVLALSADTGEGLDALKLRLRELLLAEEVAS